ncbi:MAG: aldo/keto reductase [Propionibacteriaceae bacterium]
MPVAPTVTLARGATMPVIGLGTWPLDDTEVARTLVAAVELGYRSVDTAENYGNERGVGQGLRDCGVPREELFVTSKFNKRWHSVPGARQACEASLERLGLDYLDLLLIHWPNPQQDRYVDAFAGLLALHEAGLVRAVGTSNFTVAHLERILTETGAAPDVNQIQLSPYTTRDAIRAFDAGHAICTESWSPLGAGNDLLREPIVTEIAMRCGRTAGQVVLRWHRQLGLVAVPKSSNPERLAANIDLFDFELSDDEMAALSALDQGESAATDSEQFGH